MSRLKSITGLEYLNTSQVTNMGRMFEQCRLLTEIDLSHFNTADVNHDRIVDSADIVGVIKAMK